MNRRSFSRLTLVVALLIALALGITAVVGGIYLARHHDSSAQAASRSQHSSMVSTTASTAPSSTTSASASSAPSLPPVGTNAFRYQSSGFVIDASLCAMPYTPPLNPPSGDNNTVCWVNGNFGQAPSANQPATTYFLGHAWSRSPMVLNPLSEAVTAAADFAHPTSLTGTDGDPVTRVPSNALRGDTVTVAIGGEPLVFTVDDAWLVPKTHAAADPDVMDDKRPGRIIIITCAVGNGQDLDYNVIVSAHINPDDNDGDHAGDHGSDRPGDDATLADSHEH